MRKSIRPSALSIISGLPKLVLLTAMLAFAGDSAGSKATTILAPGGRIDVFASGEEVAVAHEEIDRLGQGCLQVGRYLFWSLSCTPRCGTNYYNRGQRRSQW